MAQKRLAKEDIGSVVVNPSMINNPDLETITAALKTTNGKMVTIEDHREICGFGAMVTHALAQVHVDFKVKSLGVKDHFGRSAYTSDQLYEKYGLGIGAIVEAAKLL